MASNSMIRSLTLLLVLCGLLAATSVAAAPEPYGVWRWTQTDVTNQDSETPESSGYTRALVFHSDMSLIEYRDGEILRTGTFNYYDYTWDMGMGGVEYFTIIETDFPDFEESYNYSIGDAETTLHMCSGTHPTTGYPWYPCERFVRDNSVSASPINWETMKAIYR